MSIVILGGNECMVRQYKDLCKEYQCRVKIFTQVKGRLKNQIGNPDLLVVFTNTVSHKIVRCAMNEIKGQNPEIAHVHTSSVAALKNVLENYAV
ncbi:MAG: DUF2325 domain-containing protein [Eubacterium sp.]